MTENTDINIMLDCYLDVEKKIRRDDVKVSVPSNLCLFCDGIKVEKLFYFL